MAGTFKFATRMGPDAFNLLKEPETKPVQQKKPPARHSSARLQTGPLVSPPFESLAGQSRPFRSESTYSYTGTLVFSDTPAESDDLLSALAQENGSSPARRSGPFSLGPPTSKLVNSNTSNNVARTTATAGALQMESISTSIGAPKSVSMFLSSSGKAVPTISSNKKPPPEKQQQQTSREPGPESLALVSRAAKAQTKTLEASASVAPPAVAVARLPEIASAHAYLLGRIPCAIEAAACAEPSSIDTVLALIDRLQIEGQMKIRPEDAPLATITVDDNCVSIVRKDFIGGEERISVDELVSTFTFRAPTSSRSTAAAPGGGGGGARMSGLLGAAGGSGRSTPAAVHLALLALNEEHARLQAASPTRAPDGPLCDCFVFLLPDAQGANAFLKAITAQFQRQ